MARKIPKHPSLDIVGSDLKTLYEKFGRDEVEQSVASAILGHKSHRSGTFLYKIAALRAYGLIGGRGKIAVTAVGESISFKKDETSYNNALTQALTKVPLWSILYDKYTKTNKEIKEDEFWLDLKEQCGLTIDEAKRNATRILKSYRDDTKLINMNLLEVPNITPNTITQTDGNNIPERIPKPQSDILDIGYENYKVYLPKEIEEQKKVWKRLKKMVDAYIDPDDEE